MNDGYVAKEVFFAAALMYVYGEEALTKIEIIAEPRRETHFHLDCPSLDVAEYLNDWKGKQFAITDLSSYTGIYSRLVKILKSMNQSGTDIWCSPSWVAGRG